MAKLHVEMKCVDAHTKVRLYPTVNKSLLMMVATHAPVKDQQEQLPAHQILVDAHAMVSLCHLANKSLLVMAAIHAHVRDQVVLHVHQTPVDAPTKVEP